MSRRVLVCEAQVPFARGGAELLVRSLVDELRRHGYRAERVSIPFKWYPKGELLAHAAAWRLVDLCVDAEHLVRLYAGALGVVFPPFDEDYGYVTLEAFLARKRVVTTGDAGGPLEFVEDSVNGMIAEPTPESLGAAISRLAADRARARSLGDAGYDRARSITWDGVVERLLGSANGEG